MVFFEYDKGLEILQIKKDKVREKILSSAYEEFSEFGYSGASLRRIAEKENMTKGVIYSYLPASSRPAASTARLRSRSAATANHHRSSLLLLNMMIC